MKLKGLLFPFILATLALLAVAEKLSSDTSGSIAVVSPLIDQDGEESSHKKKKCHHNYYQSYYPHYEPHYEKKSYEHKYEKKEEPKYHEKKYHSYGYEPMYHYGGSK